MHILVGNWIKTGTLKVKLPTIDNMDRWKSRGGKSLRREEQQEEEEEEEERCLCAKKSKSRKTLCVSKLCGSGGAKSRLAKAVWGDER